MTRLLLVVAVLLSMTACAPGRTCLRTEKQVVWVTQCLRFERGYCQNQSVTTREEAVCVEWAQDAQSEPSESRLIAAVNKKDSKEVERLLVAGADPNEWGGVNNTPLLLAVWNKDLPTVRVLLRHKADPNLGACDDKCTRDDPATAPLYAATYSPCERGVPHCGLVGDQMKIVQLLLAAGANPNGKSTILGHITTALHNAALNGSVEIVDILIRHGADVNALETGFGMTPMTPLSVQKRCVEHERSWEKRRRCESVAALLKRAGGVVR